MYIFENGSLYFLELQLVFEGISDYCLFFMVKK